MEVSSQSRKAANRFETDRTGGGSRDKSLELRFKICDKLPGFSLLHASFTS